MAKDFRTVTDKFLGLHECAEGQGRVKTGESPRMKNLAVTADYSLILRDGWRMAYDLEGEGRGLWAGKYRLWAVSDRVYTDKNGEAEMIGTLESSSGEVSFFPFGDRVYILDGVKIKVYDGGSLADIDAYIPTVAIGCDYLGAGTAFEEVNMLSEYRKQSFTADGEHNVWKLAESDIDEVTGVVLNGNTVVRSKYDVDLASGTVTFDNVPSASVPDNMVITYKKANGSADEIHRMRYAVPFGENDSRVFLWGDSENPARLRYSGVHNGESGMDYFPELFFNDVPTGMAITSVTAHFDSLLVFCTSSAWQCRSERASDANGIIRTRFPMKNISAEVGCGAVNFVKRIDNTPISLSASGLYRWYSSTIRDEMNCREIGERIRLGLERLGLSGVKSFDRAERSEFYIWRGDSVYVYNYALDVFYYYEGFDAVAFACDGEGITWFLASNGSLCYFTDEKLDGGEYIGFIWQSGYEESAGLNTKNIHRIEFEVLPVSATSFKLSWLSEARAGRSEILAVDYRVSDFQNVHFDEFTFSTATAPIRLYKRVKLKRIRGFKVIVENSGDCRDFHLMSLTVDGRLTDTV